MMLQRSAFALVAVALVSGTAVAADSIDNQKSAAEATLASYLKDGNEALAKTNDKLKGIKDPKSKEAQAVASTRDGIQSNLNSLATLKAGLAQAKTSKEIIAIINQAKSIAGANAGLLASGMDPNKKKRDREIYGGKRSNRMMKDFIPKAPGSEAAEGEGPEAGGSFGEEKEGGGSASKGGDDSGDSDLGGFALSDSSGAGEGSARGAGGAGNLFGSNSPADSGASEGSSAAILGGPRQNNGVLTNPSNPGENTVTICTYETNAASPGAPKIKVCRTVSNNLGTRAR